MLSLKGYQDLLNDKNYQLPEYIDKWQKVFYGMSLHIDGVCPYYISLRNPALGWVESNFNRMYPPRYCGEAYQYIFDNQLLSRHPREPEITRQWRFSQYKPFTQAPFLQVIQVITGAIFQDSGYQLTIEDKDDNDYIWGNNFEGRDLIGYLSDKFQNIAEDPNGLFVVIPAEPYYRTTTKRIEPKVHFVHSRDIRYCPRAKDEIVFRLEDEWWAINKMGYFRFIKEDEQFVLHPEDQPYGGYYAHMTNELPVVIAGGQWNTQGYYDSWLNAAKPVADEFVASKSAEQLVNKEASHPFIVAASEDCPDCAGGKVRYCTGCSNNSESCNCGDDSHWSLRNCTECGGSGQISRGPGQWQIVPIEDMAKGDSLKIINPDVSINTFHKENNAELYNSIMRALHLDYIEEAQSGTAKDKDMETRYQFLMRICNDLFDRLIPNICNLITALRNVTSVNGSIKPAKQPILIVKPTQFQIKTEQDLLNEYDTSTKAGIPDFIRKAQAEDYVDKLYGGNDVLKKKTNIINQVDVFAVSSMADIQLALMNGIDHRKFQLHIELSGILDQIIREKSPDWFIAATFDAVKAEIDKIFLAMAPPVVPMNETIVRDNVNI